MATRRSLFLALMVALVLSACNLAGAPSQEQIAQTATAESTLAPSWTPASNGGIPTTVPVNQPTSLPTIFFPTSVVSFPTSVPPVFFPTSVPPVVFPTNTQLPVSIVILSPVSGNVVAGNVQILGSAIHPQFLQYQVEFGPDPNNNNLWFPATSAIGTPILNGLLGIWNTSTVQDSRYQLRLRVYLRDGTLLTTVVNNITVQNHINTPVPSPTQNIPRPIAAFTQDKASGDVPLTVQFTNQSSGTINSVAWNFGDGNSSGDVNPSHTFGTPGLYNVTLSVSGPGGSSNVSRQINVTSPTAPVAGFTQDRTAGVAPVTIQFQDQSSGNVSAYLWNFSDGSTSAERNPSHTFNTPGTYNVFLTVSGPGGSSSVTRQITVTSAVPPTMTPSNTPTQTWTPLPPTSTSTNTATFIPSPTPTGTITPQPPTDTVIPIDTSTPTEPATAVPPTATTVPPTATFTPTDTAIPIDTSTPTEPATAVPPTATFTPTFTNTVPPAPVAAFTAAVTPNDPLTMQFTSQSTGDNLSYVWDFGDGSDPASEPNPLHTYPAEGTYTVTLLVTDIVGQTANFSGQLSVTAPVKADFSAQSQGLAVQFTDKSTGHISTYAWDFGDQTASGDQNPQHTYAASGTYTVTLTISGLNGTTNSTSQQVTVIPPLQASFSAQVQALTVQFTDHSSGQVAQYAWDFGDQTTSGDQNPSHSYASPGTYNVTLTITGSDMQTNSQTQQVTVTAPVKAGFSAQPTDLNVQFTDQATGPIAAYAWDFGDQTTSSEQSPLHTYANAGTYTVTQTINGSNGTTDTQTQQITVSAAIQANFSAQVNGLAVQFADHSSGPVTQYAWDFGDQTTSADQNPQHTYAAAGTYNVVLTVSDGTGRSNSQTQQVTVTAPVQAAFTFQASGLAVQFTNASTGAVAQYSWDFGDGANAGDASPQHTYQAAGTYNVTLTVTGQDSTSNSQTQPVTVAQPLQASFSAQVNGANVQFTNSSTGPITIYAWDFGDQTTSGDPNPLHTYANAGTYNVTLTIGAADNTTNSQTQQVSVAAPLVANFTAQVSGTSVQFTNSSTGSVTTYAWDFGDQTTSTDQSPQHTYAAAGTYNVTLTVGDGSQTNSQTQPVTIAQPLQANFSAQVTNLDVQFTDQSTGPVTTYAWDFGDQTTSTDQSPQHTYAAAGTYNVTLTVGAADNTSNSQTQQVTTTAAQRQQTIVDTTPVLPDINGLHDALRGIYANGVNSNGTQASVFTTAGDSIFGQPGILTPFATPGQYNLDANGALQPAIDWFNSTQPSFSRPSLAVNPAWTVADLLDASKGGPSCNGEAPIVCELHASHASLMFLAVGTNDARNGTDPGVFQSTLNTVVSTIASSGTIPVLATVPDDGSIPNAEAINEAIINVAQANHVPLLNAARALRELPSVNLSAAPNGPGALDNGATTQYGVNALNLDLLHVLADARNIIFPDA